MIFRSATLLTLSAFVLVAALLTTGCAGLEYRPDAVGKEGEVAVIIDTLQWQGPVGEALREQLGQWIGTLPAPERMFDLRQYSITDQKTFDLIKRQKNIVFAAPLSDTSTVAQFLKSRLDEGATQAVLSGQRAVVPRPDLWRRNQQVFYLTAATADDLAETIQTSGEDLRYAFNRVSRERLRLDMFEKGRQPDIEDRIMDRHDFAVNVQHDYFVAIDTTNFVWLRRVLSDTWRSVFIYYEDNANPSDLTPEWIYEKRDALTRQYVQGNMGGFVAIDYRRPLETENINFLDHYGFETRGLWHMIGEDENGDMIQFGMGGAFLTYAFYDQDSSRLYLIDGMVFAPGYTKREFLRQMEVIAYTFRSSEDEAAAGQADVQQAD